MPAYKNVTLATPLLSPSQIQFRLGLVRQRTRTYPLDSMDFIMIDLERPEEIHRHAYQCAGDLTGRLLEFLAHAEGVDGLRDERLPELFERILRQRRPSGLFGRIIADPLLTHECFAACNRYFPGFIHYYELTNDGRALDAAVGLADLTIRSTELWRQRLKATGGRSIEFWITEPMALLYGITGKREYLDFLDMIQDDLQMPDLGAHAHGYMATLRGLQTAALVTGDAAWNSKAEAARRMIIERHYEMPDGCTPESFPHSGATEGCSMADWLMLNLNTAAITGNDAAYEHAERILWNALAFNQWCTGSFGIRATTPDGYGLRRFEEAWWCCVHHGGLALVEYARHAVTLRDNTIQINLLVPGLYRLALPGGREAECASPRHIRHAPKQRSKPSECRRICRCACGCRRACGNRSSPKRVTATASGCVWRDAWGIMWSPAMAVSCLNTVRWCCPRRSTPGRRKHGPQAKPMPRPAISPMSCPKACLSSNCRRRIPTACSGCRLCRIRTGCISTKARRRAAVWPARRPMCP